KLRKDLPRDLETICLKAMAKRPQDRYSDCQTLANDLRRWLDGEPIRARRLGLAERFVRWCKREPRIAASGLIPLASLPLGVLILGVRVREAVAATAQAVLERDAGREGREKAEGEP